MPTPEDYAANKLNDLLNHESSSESESERSESERSGPTGPRTAEGKKRSSQNATRHGLAGRVVVLPTEDLDEYSRFAKGVIASLTPETAEEIACAQTIADGYWRLKRVRTFEDTILALGHYEGQGDFDAEHETIHAAFTGAKTFRDHLPSFATISLYETRIHRNIDRAKKALLESQARREERRKAELPGLLRLYDFNKMLDSQPDAESYQRAELVVHEFVYSTRQTEIEARRRTAREQAKLAERYHFNYAEFQKMAA
jgi:hypothetical protein